MDSKEEKLATSLVQQLRFQPLRNEQAVQFKLRAVQILGGFPDHLAVPVMLRAVREGGGMVWLSALAAKGISISTMQQFWECFQAEYLPVSPKFDAYGRFARLRMYQQMSVASFTEAFREAYNGLLAIGAPALPDEFLAYSYLHKKNNDMRRKVFQAVAGQRLTWAAVEAKALAIGAVAPVPTAQPAAAKVTVMHGTIHGRCWKCGEPGHKAIDCSAKEKKEAGTAADEAADEEHK